MSAPTDWMNTLQKAQTDFMQQWTALSSAWFPAATAGTPGTPVGQPPGGAGASGAAAGLLPGMTNPTDLMRQFMSQFEHYVGMSRSLWELVSNASSQPSAELRTKFFNDGIANLQQQMAGLWSATIPGAQNALGFGSNAAPPAWPALGPNREQQELWQKLTQALTRVAQAQLALGKHWNEIVAQSLRGLGGRLAPGLQSGTPPSSMKELYDQWINTAESTYAQTAHGAAFVAAQAELTDALSQLRVTQRELYEQWARQFDLPTRTELNAVHQQLRELRAALQRLGGV